jgi:hypothetical protein
LPLKTVVWQCAALVLPAFVLVLLQLMLLLLLLPLQMLLPVQLPVLL